MAAKTPTAPETETVNDEEWETIEVGLGREWDLETEGPIVGYLTGMKTLQVEDKQNGGMRDTNAYQIDVSGDPRFIWGSYEIDQAFQTGQDGEPIPTGAKIRVSFLGRSTFTGEKGPQTVKNYKVQIAKGS